MQSSAASSKRGILALALGLTLASGGASAWAQATATGAPPTAPARPEAASPKPDTASPPRAEPARAEATSPRSEGVQEAKPAVYYVRDKDGKLEPLLNFTLEDFERLLLGGAGQGAANSRPNYRLERISIRGAAKQDRAELTARFEVSAEDKSWVRVPLRLGGAVIRKAATYEGPGEFFLEFDDASDEYVAWFRGAGAKPHVLTLDLLAPLAALAGETRLKLSFPRAVESELVFAVPGKKVIGQVSAESVLESTAAVGSQTEFKVLGLTADFALSWRVGETRTAETPAVLEASGGLVARIDGRSINTQAQLSVRSFGGEFESFRVRLPAGAILLTGDQPEFSLRAVPPAKPNEPGNPVIEVRLKARTAGPVHIRLVTEQTYDVTKQQQGIDLAGFEVLGAVRQWGHMAVQVVGDWQVSWGQRRLVRQVEDLPPELWRDDLLAGFEYFGQPFSLLAQVSPRETRVSVEPEYRVTVGAQRVDLEARLAYRVGGAKAFGFDIDLAGWQIDDVGPRSRIDVEALAAAKVDPLKIPLRDPLVGDLELTIRAHRSLAAGAKALEFPLPRPLAGSVGPALVVLMSAENVDLAPRDAECVGLVRQMARLDPRAPTGERPSFVYRSDTPVARFAANVRVFQRRVSVALRTHVTVGAEGGKVQEQLTYDIAREPLAAVSLEVPRRVVEQGQLEVEGGGQTLTWQIAGDNTRAPADKVLVRVALPAERIGTSVLTLNYAWTETAPPPLSSVSFHVPLARPIEGDLVSNDLTVRSEPGVHVRQLDNLWQAVAAADAPPAGDDDPAAGQLRFTSDMARSELVLGVRRDDLPAGEPSIVERAWIQTWVTDHSREDRAVYRIVTNERTWRFKLPAGALLARVLVDGHAVVPQQGTSPDDLAVVFDRAGDDEANTSSATEHMHVVEIAYHLPERKAKAARWTPEFQAPVLEANVWVQRLYWQLVLPRDEVLLGAPAGFTEESVWSWQSLGWQRRALLDQSQLETWSGARREEPLPAYERHYLFSTAGSEHMLRVRTVRLSYLVLAVSGTLLALGLAVIYLPALRHPAVALVAAFALVVGATVFPEIAVIAAQSAALGLILLLLGAWIARSSASSYEQRRMRRRGVTPLVERGSTQTHLRPPLPAQNLPASTAAAFAAPLGGPEGQP